MNNIKAPLVSIIIVTFNSRKHIESCLDRVFQTKYSPFEIIVVDNASTDDTATIIKSKYPKVKIILSKDNLGYAGGNNLGVSYAKGQVISILNPDTQVSENWLGPLVTALKESKVAVCQPKIMLSQKTNLINTTGKVTHFLGFEWLDNYQKKDHLITQQEITSFSGSAFVIKKNIFSQLKGFDSSFFMYYEDGDLSWRVRLAGYKMILVPNSVVYHEYKYKPDENYQKARKKFYFLERNRLLMLFKNYSSKTLIILLPTLIFMEIGMSIYFFTKGWWKEIFRKYYWIAKNYSYILKERDLIQNSRKLSDKQISEKFEGAVMFKEFDNFILRYLTNPLLNVYWQIAKKII